MNRDTIVMREAATALWRRTTRRGPRGLTVLMAALLALSSACSFLDSTGTKDVTHSVDPEMPPVVVTIGGLPVSTPPAGVAATIPDSTPLPRIDLPTAAPSAQKPPPSPGASGPSAAARAARPPNALTATGSPQPATP